MSEIILRNVGKTYDGHTYAVKGVNLDIKDKEFVILVGPSGCGKSTTLRMIAGLEDISDGEMWVDGELNNYLDPQQRGLSMVFQSYALYPNMNVYDNLAFSLKIRGIAKDQIDKRVRQVAELLQITDFLKRYPAALSGGQRQRVAIGSAIMRKPKAFLMDEPLSNLDAKLRAQMRVELQKLHRALGTTIIYVTHDQTEAMTLGTLIVVMRHGVVQQADKPTVVYDHPANIFVGGFIGQYSMNFINATVRQEEGRTVLVFEKEDGRTDRGEVEVPGERGALLKERYNNQRVILGIRPEHIYDRADAERLGFASMSRGISETVTAREMLGAEVMLYFMRQGVKQSARMRPDNSTKVGESIDLFYDPSQIHVFDRETEASVFAELDARDDAAKAADDAQKEEVGA
ncbi:ABC transporter ATP-binding protein [Bifidobacterium vespertilionis]|uniref:ABC transporter ATP-binding protein n=1 Tax=Bifidobacterium vespertilionis TaxID=2562524 RepID=A0A5J5E380_9BIFI|nr:ABC transporter ATP-binding protein [Bifidobacterium vespertilionis]KAA8822011.1 ABC transporter ATP-binding protein [Bifidobacterium vespertilionis]KAA8823548.1 ABC transporter ATP-binding protein [Bifidobacterium vespertilionis]